MNLKEIWKNVIGHENYEVSNTGKIRSLSLRHGENKLLSYCIASNQERTVRFYGENPRRVLVAEVVAKAFLPNPNAFLFLRHKDLNPANNHFLNLEWMNYDPFKGNIDNIPDKGEEWRQIPNFEDYEISNFGRLKSRRRGSNILMSPSIDRYGYRKVMLSKNGKPHHFMIHRLVAMTFIPNSRGVNQINHRNGNKLCNHVDNLEWCTAQENILHAVETGLKKRGEEHRFAKITEKKVLEIRSKYIPQKYTMKKLAEEHGLKISCVSDIVLRRSWKHI